MSLLDVCLFGSLEVRRGPDVLPGFELRKVRELFAYLLLFRDRPHPRETLADQLWPESCTDHPAQCLRKALWQLRAALDLPPQPLGDRVLSIEADWIQLRPGADVWLDAAALEAAFDSAQGVPGRALSPQAARDLHAAVGLYRGGLAEKWLHDWYLVERERFQRMYLILLDKLLDYSEAHGDYEAGLAYGARILQCERASERAHRRMMRLYYLAGDRTAALRQYQQCAHALQEELAVRPAHRTQALYEQIRADLGPVPAPPAFSPAGLLPAPPGLAPPDMLGRLRHLHAFLVELQVDLNRELQAAELALSGRDRPA
jgi:DNA-binding SARP family transcriptional activator